MTEQQPQMEKAETGLAVSWEMADKADHPPQAWATGSFALLSDIGQVRELNEDSAFAMMQATASLSGAQSLGIFLLADGMGGHEAGERASLAAIRSSSMCLLREVGLPMADPTGEMGQTVPLQESLEHAFRTAHQRVQSEVPQGATTLLAAVLLGRRLYVGHAGDGRLYLWRGGRLRQLTRDHSLLSRLIELAQLDTLDSEDLTNDPRRNALYRAIGQPGEMEMDLFAQPLEPGDRLMLCTDGLWGCVSEQCLAEALAGPDDPQTACQTLVDAANRAGGPDNISVIVIHPAW